MLLCYGPVLLGGVCNFFTRRLGYPHERIFIFSKQDYTSFRVFEPKVVRFYDAQGKKEITFTTCLGVLKY